MKRKYKNQVLAKGIDKESGETQRQVRGEGAQTPRSEFRVPLRLHASNCFL